MMSKQGNTRGNLIKDIIVMLVIAVAFFATGSGYLSWLYHLGEYVDASMADYLSEVIGYLFQVLGMAGFILLYKKYLKKIGVDSTRNAFIVAVIQDLLCIVLAVLAQGLVLTLFFGYAMNILHGFVAGFYLELLARRGDRARVGIVFGGGYAIGTIGSYVISLIEGGTFLKNKYVLIAYGAFALLAIWLIYFANREVNRKPRMVVSGVGGEIAGGCDTKHINYNSDIDSEEHLESESEQELVSRKPIAASRKIILLAGIMVLLLSCVKGLGFYFPMADLSSGVFSLEYVRLFYAVGLIIAGIINDKKPSTGALCCMASLVIPFVMLALSAYATASQVLWIIGYFFFGFFAVYRIKIFAEISDDRDALCLLLPCGLMIGRLGDVLGSMLGMKLGSYIVPFLIVGSVLFVITVFVFFDFYMKSYLNVNVSSYNKALLNGNEIQPGNLLQEGLANAQGQTYGEVEQPRQKQLIAFSEKYDISIREREVLELVLDGASNSEIAQKLYVSENTIKFHMRNILHKTKCNNRKELIAKYNL